MQEIDLGDEVQLKVKYKSKEYVLREPTVSELENLKNSDQDKLDMPDFLDKLGMPGDVVRSMGMSKAKALVEGLLDLVSKKK